MKIQLDKCEKDDIIAAYPVQEWEQNNL